MSRSRKSASYGFTTTEKDAFILRVGKEAKPHDDFIVASAKTPNNQSLTLMVRESKIPLKSVGFELFGAALHKKWGKKIVGTPFRAATFQVDNIRKASNIAKDTLHRLKNFHLGRTTRVLVESV